jgi:hypothetical protein
MKSNKLINLGLFLFGFVLFFCIVIILNSSVVYLGQEIKDINQGLAISNHIKKNNLTLPFPNKNKLEWNNGIYDYNTKIYLETFSKDYEEFRIILNSNYYYELGKYDCKYWSYVWTLYWKKNKERYNWKLDFITTENHLFVMVSNESGYIILDGNNQINFMY